MPERSLRPRWDDEESDAWLLRRRGYRTDTVPLDGGRFYWHVYLHGERVNGGLSDSLQDAREDAVRAARQDSVHRKTLWR